MKNSPDHSAADYDAAQPDPRQPVGHIHIRTTLRRKSAWVHYFNGQNQKLPEGIVALIDRATGYAEEQKL